jgi:hypothetical protein
MKLDSQIRAAQIYGTIAAHTDSKPNQQPVKTFRRRVQPIAAAPAVKPKPRYLRLGQYVDIIA